MIHILLYILLGVEAIIVVGSLTLAFKEPIGGALYFWFVQNASFVLMVLGWVLLLPWSMMRLWYYGHNQSNTRVVAMWNSAWMDNIYGNAEDGVDPGDRLVVNGTATYMPGAPQWWRVYMWTAWRNSTNNLRWLFLWEGGPWFQVRKWGWYMQAGFRPDNGWPVFSAGTGKGTQI